MTLGWRALIREGGGDPDSDECPRMLRWSRDLTNDEREFLMRSMLIGFGVPGQDPDAQND